MKRWAWVPAVVLALAGCAVPYDGDGELGSSFGEFGSASTKDPDATPVVFDTDLAGDDLAALAFLLRRPDVSVEAVTIAATGLVGCDPGVDLVANLVVAMGESPVLVSCGRDEPGPGGREWPREWVVQAESGTGVPPSEITFRATPQRAPQMIAQLADQYPGELAVVAVGPLTNLADLADQWPESYAQIGAIQVMGGAVDVPSVDGVAEWNAAADPEAFAAVLANDAVPLTIVPDDAIPSGTPDGLDAPVVGAISAVYAPPKWWDLSTSAAFVTPDAVSSSSGTWDVDESGRMRRTGEGSVVVATRLDRAKLVAAFEETFG